MSNKKTLVILTPGFPKDELDTTCLPLQQELTRTLKEMNPHWAIIVLSFQYPYHTHTYEWNGITVIPFNGRNKGGIARLLRAKHVYAALHKIHTSTPIHGLLSFWYGECAIAGKAFARKKNIRHFCWLLGQDARKANKYPKKEKPFAGELIALSDFLRREFEKNHAVKAAHVIPPGINHRLFDDNNFERDIDILGVGSLIPLKNFNTWLEAVAQIKAKMPAVKAVLIGDGPEKKDLQKRITETDLAGNITLMGELPYKEVIGQMQRSKLLLHPSAYEGFSGVCLEALAAGAYAISFCRAMDNDIPQWHIVNSTNEMTQAALSLLENSTTCYQKMIHFPIQDTAKKMMTLFSNCV